jgi:hypothetical protein
MTIVAETEPGCDASIAARIKRELHDLLSLSRRSVSARRAPIERPQGKAVRVVERRPH